MNNNLPGEHHLYLFVKTFTGLLLVYLLVCLPFNEALSQNTGIGLTDPSTTLDVDGTALFRNGNTFASSINNQIQFGPAGQNTFMHAIKSRHNGSNTFGNAIDFYLFDVGVDANTTVGTQHVLSVEGFAGGRVGIGTTTPDAKLDVEGGLVRFSDYGNNSITGTATSVLGVEADGDLIEVNATTLNRNIYDVDGTLVGNRLVTQNNFDLNFDANTLVISGDNNRVGIGNSTPVSKLSVGTPINVGSIPYAESSLTIFSSVNNGGNTPAAPEDMLHLVREGVNSEAWGNRASFELSRYENSATNSRTQLDIKLANTHFTSDNTVLSLRSNGNVGVGESAPSATLHVGGDVRIETLPVGADTDELISTDANGNLRKVNGLKAAKVFYPPSIAIDATTDGVDFTKDLYAEYIAQFGSPTVVSDGAPTTIPTYGATDLWYYVTYADPLVFANMEIDANGVLEYDIIDQPFDQNSLINVVFVVK